MAISRQAGICVALVLLFGMETSEAQQARVPSSYPDRPIRLIVPFPPAGANEIIARGVGQRLTTAWGQPIIIDNRPGAGVTGTAIAAKTAANGYTLVLVPATHAINVSLYKNPPYDALADFAPVALVATAPYMLVVNPAVPVHSMKELIAYAKSNPGQLNYASVAVGNATHLMASGAGIRAGRRQSGAFCATRQGRNRQMGESGKDVGRAPRLMEHPNADVLLGRKAALSWGRVRAGKLYLRRSNNGL